MWKLIPLLFGAMLLLGVSSTPGQDKKPPTTLEEDWKTLCRFQWVNSDPKEAWALLPNEHKAAYTFQGAKGWSKIEVSFSDGSQKNQRHISAAWHYVDSKGQEKTLPNLFGVKIDLQEEKGERFLLRGKTKIKYDLKEGVLILNGVDEIAKGAAPFVYTGKYKGVERKNKK